MKKNNTAERITQLNEYEYFMMRPGLADAIAKIEMKTGIKIPNTFREIVMGEVRYGNLFMTMGKVGQYYFFGVSEDRDYWMYEAFDTKQAFKLFFANDGIDSEIAAFFLREIEEIPNII